MNRKIKFRAYDDYLQTLREVTFGEIKNYSEDDLMQYTGVKDKNDREIWEGDIVQTTTEDGDVVSVGDIQFSHGVFGAEWTRNKTNKSMVGASGQYHNLKTIDDTIIGRLEVIGNIYENPEKLNKDE